MKLSNLNSFLKEEWLPFLNANLKWGVSLLLRTLFITLTIILIIFSIKVTGVVKTIRSMAIEQVMGIAPKETTTISVPDIDYTTDIDELDKLINILEGQLPGKEDEKK